MLFCFCLDCDYQDRNAEKIEEQRKEREEKQKKEEEKRKKINIGIDFYLMRLILLVI